MTLLDEFRDEITQRVEALELGAQFSLRTLFGPVTELFRSFDLVFCHKGETSWHRNQPRNSAEKQCA